MNRGGQRRKIKMRKELRIREFFWKGAEESWADAKRHSPSVCSVTRIFISL